MKAISTAVCLALAACGSDGSETPAADSAPTSYADVVFIGDSITAYWTTLDAYFPGAVNAGIGGETCQQMAARFPQDVMSYHPKVVVILCGTNDIRYNLSDNQQYLIDMVETAEAGNAKVIVGELPPNTGWAMQNDNYPQIGQAEYLAWNKAVIAGAKSYSYAVADYYDAMLLNGSQNASLFKSDGTHPNAAGYAVMARVLQPLLTEDLE
jgi:lysophospholipase L1-like esterase